MIMLKTTAVFFVGLLYAGLANAAPVILHGNITCEDLVGEDGDELSWETVCTSVPEFSKDVVSGIEFDKSDVIVGFRPGAFAYPPTCTFTPQGRGDGCQMIRLDLKGVRIANCTYAKTVSLICVGETP